MTDSSGMSTDHAKTCAKDRSRNELGERKNKVADVAKPGAGTAEGDAARERGPQASSTASGCLLDTQGLHADKLTSESHAQYEKC